MRNQKNPVKKEKTAKNSKKLLTHYIASAIIEITQNHGVQAP